MQISTEQFKQSFAQQKQEFHNVNQFSKTTIGIMKGLVWSA